MAVIILAFSCYSDLSEDPTLIYSCITCSCQLIFDTFGIFVFFYFQHTNKLDSALT